MTTLHEAARQAIKAMLNFPEDISDEMFESIRSLKAALKQPNDSAAYDGWVLRDVFFDSGEPVGHREPQPLTDEEIRGLWDNHIVPVFGTKGINPIVFARAIEAAHRIKEKNK
jgi:hypothetical protein